MSQLITIILGIFLLILILSMLNINPTSQKLIKFPENITINQSKLIRPPKIYNIGGNPITWSPIHIPQHWHGHHPRHHHSHHNHGH